MIVSLIVCIAIVNIPMPIIISNTFLDYGTIDQYNLLGILVSLLTICCVYMKCPYCGSQNTKVVDKRDKCDEGITRRRRECLECEKRFTTYERIENVDLTVLKKDGSTQQYDRAKLQKSISKSVDLEKVSEEKVEQVVDEIEMKLLNMDSIEVKSDEIGRLVLEHLKDLDQIAYMRFASVYKDFRTLEQFKKELQSLGLCEDK